MKPCYNSQTIQKQSIDDFWTHDAPLFVGQFPYYRNDPRMVQARLYVSEEHFYNSLVSEVIPLSSKEGKRQYILMTLTRGFWLIPSLLSKNETHRCTSVC